jgi:hypothetical protein
MEPKTSNNLPDNMNIVVVIDKEKLPEDVRKILEENLPKEIQEKVMKMLDKETARNPPDQPDNNSNKLFAIQTGSVVGNIYTDGIYKKEEDSHVKKLEIKDSGGCC